MQKSLRTLLIMAFVYGLPLAFRPELLAHWKLLTVAVGAAIMFVSQPSFSLKDANDRKNSDRSSMIYILVGGMLSQIVPVVEWGYFGQDLGALGQPVATLLGLCMLVAGLAFRFWSIRWLGKQFTSTVQIVDSHELITSGPYAVVRHPSYLGALVAMVGAALFLNAVFGTVVTIVLMALAYRLRIKTEEETLIGQFGDDYRSYISSVPAIIPRLSKPVICGTVMIVVVMALILSLEFPLETSIEDWQVTWPDPKK